ncbi:hypothetical protein F7734_58710 [Scytonema sp. UIC 10036]|uniref:hypothetical protein n=1 Tax=Scytonema sp. UIC 10036 TaxID=2304196 RepID=UPI0012DA0935|nr:hypothetical protein [Scytonema sp. UIC 10036]MUH01579.1 hypothetical protein [Scytonema sp. UIC 10036]
MPHYTKIFDSLVHPSLLTSACEILNSDVYVYQLKSTLKRFWRDLWRGIKTYILGQEDGMPSRKH